MAGPDYPGLDTLALHAGAQPDPATGARATPIYQSASFCFPDSDFAASLFNIERAGHVYSRLSNPTNAVLEERIAALEGGVGAIATASGTGYRITPSLIKSRDSNTPLKLRVFSDSTTRAVRSMMRRVVSHEDGSGNFAEAPGYMVGGKTGTAEDWKTGLDHAWFVCFTPSDDTELLIVAFAQNTPGGGSRHALPMAREILKVWNEKN